MFTILLITIVGALCFFVIVLNYIEKKNNILFNNYLISILIIAGLMRLIPLLGFIMTKWDHEDVIMIMALSVIFLIPLYFLNLYTVVNSKLTKGYLCHSIIPILILIYYLIFQFISKFNLGVFIFIYSSIYVIMSVVVIVRFLMQKSENIIAFIFKKKVRNWLIVFMTFSIYLYLIVLNSFANFAFSIKIFQFLDAYILTTVGYLIILIYIILNRNLILGKLTSKNYKEISLLFWSNSPLKKIEKKDVSQYNKLMPEELINGIIDMQKNYIQVLDKKYSYGDISERMKVPLYKVKLLFKYHTPLSLTEFVNTIRIFRALILIEEGYLNSFTVESLGKKIGFNSRITFYNNFSKYMGMSVRNYIEKIDHLL